MQQQNYNVIGVMSGTSLDGIDLAHINFSIIDGKWHFNIRECETLPYDEQWLQRLKTATDLDENGLNLLNSDYTILLGNFISHFISQHSLKGLDAICSHGHTILHNPSEGYTLQIGNLREIAEILNETIVCDFRVQDVKLGGQGAPLVPIGDRMLFATYDYCLNLGGFSNISFEQENKRVAFDISPVNTVLNFYANQLGFAYDDKGHLAAAGEISPPQLEALNNLDFYSRPFPKSLGFEFVKETILPLMESFLMTPEDKLRTFTRHIAEQIVAALPRKTGSMLITGGGAYNDFLIQEITSALPEMQIVIPEKKVLEYKEALIFGLLGVLKLRDEVNVLSSVTGAERDHSSGIIYN